MIKAGSVPNFYSYEKAKKQLGYEPEKSFREAVEDMAEYYEQRDFFSKMEREADKLVLEKKKWVEE